MNLTYTITLADWKAAIRLHTRQKPGRRICLAISYYAIPTLAGLGLGYISLASSHGRRDIVDGLVLPVAALFGIAVLRPFLYGYRLRKWFTGYFPVSETGPGHSLDIDNERILKIWPGIGEAKYYWTGIRRFAQDNRITVLYIT